MVTKSVCFLVPRRMVKQFIELMELNNVETWQVEEKEDGCAAVIAVIPDHMIHEHDEDGEHVCEDCKAVEEVWDGKKPGGGEGGGKKQN